MTDTVTQTPPRRSMVAQLARFVVVGVFCALLDYGTYQGLRALGMSVAPWADIARACSFVVGTTTAYFLNKRFTFDGADGGAKQVSGFVLLYGTTFAVAVAVNRLMLAVLPAAGWAPTVAWVISQGTATAINFVMLRFVIFRPARSARSAR